jgi:hypothetical protein
MGDIEIQVEKDAFISKLEAKIGELPERLTNMVSDIADNVEIVMKDEAPYNKGMLRRTITTESVDDTTRWVGPTVEYAPYVVYGTRPHIIEAKNAKALGPFAFSSYLGVRFGGHADAKKAGSVEGLQFFTSVHHPGTQPDDFVTRAKERSEGRNDAIIEKFMGWLTE